MKKVDELKKQWKSNGEHALALRGFLASETGKLLMEILRESSPLEVNSDPDRLLNPSTIQADATNETGREQALYHSSKGHSQCRKLLTDTLPDLTPEEPKQKRRGNSVPPHATKIS